MQMERSRFRLHASYSKRLGANCRHVAVLLLLACSASAFRDQHESAKSITISISPARATIPSCGTQQFATGVTEAADSKLTWSGTGSGTVPSSGLYSTQSTSAKPTASAAVSRATNSINSASAPGTVVAKLSAKNIIPSSLFGMTLVEKRNWPTVQVGVLGKGTATTWGYIQKKEGVFDWTNLDAWVNTAQSHGVDFVYANDGSPPWAVSDKSGCAPHYSAGPPICNSMVSDLRDFDNFVAALAARYKGRIKAYELWNEPDQGSSWAGTMADFVTLTQHMYNIIRSTDPAAMIIGPAPQQVSLSATWLDRYFAAGGVRTIDAVTTHCYPHHFADIPEAIVEYGAAAKRVMAKYGLTGKPLWCTEGSWGLQTQPGWQVTDQDEQAGFVGRYYLLSWSNGFSRLYWYAWDNAEWGPLWDSTNGIHQAGIAYEQVYHWMVGAAMNAPCSVSGTVWTCGLVRPGGYQALAVWNTSGSSIYTPISQYTRYRDLTGNAFTITNRSVKIGFRPVLLE